MKKLDYLKITGKLCTSHVFEIATETALDQIRDSDFVFNYSVQLTTDEYSNSYNANVMNLFDYHSYNFVAAMLSN